jgi:hypothetical protein
MDRMNWQVRETAHFVFHYLPGSYAANRLSWLTARAERCHQALRDFLGEDGKVGGKIHVYCTLLHQHPGRPEEQLVSSAYVDAETGDIWAVCRPESPAEGLEEAIGHLLLLLPYARAAGDVPFLRARLVGYVLAQAGSKPRPEQRHQAPISRMQQGEPIMVLPALVARSVVNQRDDGLALSFIAGSRDRCADQRHAGAGDAGVDDDQRHPPPDFGGQRGPYSGA